MGARAALFLFLSVFSAAQVRRPDSQIKYVVIIFQENRSPDNLFHGLPKADIANVGLDSHGKQVKLTPIPLVNNYDLNHINSAFTIMYDDGQMDRANENPITCAKGARKCPPLHPQYKYVRHSDVKPYFALAKQYTFGDRMFQTNEGSSFPAHQFIIAGTSAPTADSNLFDADNPRGIPHPFLSAGCRAPLGEYVKLIDPFGDQHSEMYPCFEHLTLMDLLDDQGISWRYYSPSPGMIWTAPNAIGHLRFGPDWKNVIFNPPQVLSDIANGNLASVNWVMPTGQASDHPASNKGLGPSWVASIVNAIGQSPYWDSTAIFITWDDWGGWYDHVPPPAVIRDGLSWGSGYVYGFRVPLIVVSPYAKQHYVSKVNHDFGSILRFVEETYGLPSLGYADAHADDLSDCFDFQHNGHTFRKILAPYDAKYFLSDTEPATDPDDE